MNKILCMILCGLSMFVLGCSQEPHPRESRTIKILCAKWAPSDYLQKLSADFTRETGINVVVDQVVWDDFYKVFFDHAAEYDLVGGDSQWLGKGSMGGYYADLSRWIARNGVDKSMTEASIVGYSEYPKGSGRYWAVPLMADAMGFAYRKDLFEDEKEKAAFKAKYGYDLAIPRTWQELLDIAKFFYRPEQNFYGVNVWAGRSYDALAMGIETFVWAWGADIGDQQSYKVLGILNTREGAQALEMYKKLHKLGAPEWKSAYLEINEALMRGKVAMVMSYFAFFPDLLDPKKNPYASVTGFFANPAGPKARVSSLGGQGLSVVSFSQKKEEALQFLEWFVREDVQQKWARLGGYTCNKAVLNSEEFLNATPYNRAMKESIMMMRDFWVVPEYLDLLAAAREYWGEYLFSDHLTAQEAMDAVARAWENIFEAAGYYKE